MFPGKQRSAADLLKFIALSNRGKVPRLRMATRISEISIDFKLHDDHSFGEHKVPH